MTSALSAPGRLTRVHPLWAIEGGLLTIEGDGFAIDPPPSVRVGPTLARLAHATPTALTALVPAGLDGGSTPVRLDDVPGETAYVEIGVPLATGVHLVDNPAFDRHGNLYVTLSGSRGERTPVAIFVVRPDGTRQPFVTDVPNPTSLAFDAEGRLYVSSRFDGSVYQVDTDGRATLFASDLGVACGLAFGPDGLLYVGDRSGSVLRVNPDGAATVVAALPPSVAAFHLAFGPDEALYVSAPTLSSHDVLYRVDASGDVSVCCRGFGRPQGLAFDTAGRLYVADALAGSSGVFRVRIGEEAPPELVLAGGSVIGLAFDPHGGLAVASAETVYRLQTGDRGLLPPATADSG